MLTTAAQTDTETSILILYPEVKVIPGIELNTVVVALVSS
jgi:hypothetical protein